MSLLDCKKTQCRYDIRNEMKNVINSQITEYQSRNLERLKRIKILSFQKYGLVCARVTTPERP
jgi:hypothetical protein